MGLSLLLIILAESRNRGIIRDSKGDRIVRLLLRKLGNPPVHHSFCQANKVAHVLARQGSKLTASSQDTILAAPPSHVKDQLMTDKEGTILSKLVFVASCNKLVCFDNLSVIIDNNNVHVTMNTSTTT
ncbi:hypothetical protein HAX54_017221 [Datura stramonium]|uniref:RNase H type-1 domain-containing protein n=1 Tax=Datura stramonium TaxID=4076 RepID=A0ABS8UKD1_DATST|nr:hypothetical protein [Datura stramonium]